MADEIIKIDSGSKPRRLLHAFKCSFMDFMTHTSTHGAKYICEDDRFLFERLFWVVMIGLGYGTAGFMATNIYVRYTASPTNTIMEHTHYPTWRLPFPAVTICNNNRILQTRAEQFIQKLNLPQHLSQEWVLERLKSLIQLNNPEVTPRSEYAIIQDILDSHDIKVADIMLELSQPCGELLERCSWQNEIVSCSDLFESRKSHLGYCCSFNYVGVPDTKKRKEVYLSESPLHTRLNGQHMGLTMLINPAIDDYFISSFMSTGVAVHIHDSYVYPGEQIIMKMVPVNKEVLIPIRMSKRTCTEDVQSLSPESRECLFPDENNLEFFPKYLDANCITECRMNYSIHHCACIPYFYPDNGKHRICDLADANCLYENFELLHSFKPGVDAENKLIVEEHESYLNAAISATNSMVCDCPTQCEGISHEARVSWGDFKASKDSVNQLFGPDTNDTNRILLHVYLESNFSQVSKRDIATTKSVLIGLLGGICSLFLGCSFVTPIELTYFCSIRLPGFFRNETFAGTPCPASPKSIRNTISFPKSAVRDLRFPSVRVQNSHAKIIEILPSDYIQN